MTERAVVFAGAGFSKAFDLPLTSELWKLGQVKNSEAEKTGLLWDDLTGCDPFVQSVARGDGDVERLLNEWEDHVERLESRRPMPNSLESGRAYRDHYVTNLTMHLEECSKGLRARSEAQSLAMWMSGAAKDFELSFVTTNYDRVIETLLDMVGLKYGYVTGGTKGVPIRKLHGSVNWMRFSKPARRIMDGWMADQIGEADDNKIFDFRLEPIAWIASAIPPGHHPAYQEQEVSPDLRAADEGRAGLVDESRSDHVRWLPSRLLASTGGQLYSSGERQEGNSRLSRRVGIRPARGPASRAGR